VAPATKAAIRLRHSISCRGGPAARAGLARRSKQLVATGKQQLRPACLCDRNSFGLVIVSALGSFATHFGPVVITGAIRISLVLVIKQGAKSRGAAWLARGRRLALRSPVRSKARDGRNQVIPPIRRLSANKRHCWRSSEPVLMQHRSSSLPGAVRCSAPASKAHLVFNQQSKPAC
jgi:hypothetical protein